MPDLLEFEEPIGVLLKEIEALSMLPRTPERERSIETLRRRADEIRGELYANLTPWQRVLVARHPARPNTLDYVERLFTGFDELHGDRRFADDHAIVCGFADYKGQPVAIVGHQKGRDTKQKIFRNFGYARPEGYRKALRVMQLAQKFGRPIVVFIDTPAAYPGVESEERGVAEAIAFNLREMMMLEVPIVVIVCGEGGSGGALGIAIGDRVLMQEFSVYSVIPPEGCAAILWRDAEPQGRGRGGAEDHGARTCWRSGSSTRSFRSRPAAPTTTTTRRRRSSIRRSPQALAESSTLGVDERLAGRYDKFRRMGARARRSSTPARPSTRAGLVSAMKSLLWQHLPCNDDDAVGARGGAEPPPDRRAAAVPARPRRSGRRRERFLHPSLDHLHDPFQLADMERAVERLEQALATRRADRDPRRLRRRRHHLDRHPAPRARDARRRRRPLHPRAAARRLRPAAGGDRSPARREVVRSSCRSTAASAAPTRRGARASSGVDLIITDHHEPEGTLPDALAVINPKRHDCTYPDKHLAGVGVALKLVQALCTRAGQGEVAAGVRQDRGDRHARRRRAARRREPRHRAARPRVAQHAGRTPIGLRSLLDASGLTGKTIDSYQVAFMLAPRVNAAGRMSTPDIATRLLLATDEGDGARKRAGSRSS